MAAPPPEPPPTLVVGSFAGIRNTVSEERLKPEDLAAAVNVDIDDAGQLRRRRGYARIDAADYHSLVAIAGQCLVVKDGVLGTLDTGYRFTPLVAVGPERLCYTRVGATVFFASSVASGKIVDGMVKPWGAEAGAGQWISPVLRPTATLGAVSGRMLTAPPTATAIESYKGRIYLAAGRVLWATELFKYDLVDKTRNFLMFEDDITLLAAVDDGLYVGTTAQLLFLAGTFAKGMSLTALTESPVIAGSAVRVPYAKAHPQARQGPVPEGTGPLFMTGAGICLGLPNGQVFNLTQDHVVFPSAQSAAALYREDQGANSYVAVADSAGGPSANARIGDYVDAQIVRVSQGG